MWEVIKWEGLVREELLVLSMSGAWMSSNEQRVYNSHTTINLYSPPPLHYSTVVQRALQKQWIKNLVIVGDIKKMGFQCMLKCLNVWHMSQLKWQFVPRCGSSHTEGSLADLRLWSWYDAPQINDRNAARFCSDELRTSISVIYSGLLLFAAACIRMQSLYFIR